MRDTEAPSASSRCSSLRRPFSPRALVWATSVRTTTPRVTAAASAFSISLESSRKMCMSMLRRAFWIAFSTGKTPSSG